MYNVREYTFSSCTDIQAWEHKLTFVWLESCKRTVLNTKTHMRKEGGPGGRGHGWRTKETISNPRSGNGASSPLLSSPFAPCWRKLLHWSDSTHQRVWASPPERNASLFPPALDFRYTVKPGVHNCMYRTRSHTHEGRRIAQWHRSTRTHTPSPPVLQLQLTCTVPYVHTRSPPLTPVHHALTFWCRSPRRTSTSKYAANVCFSASLQRVPSLQACMRSPTPAVHPRDTALSSGTPDLLSGLLCLASFPLYVLLLWGCPPAQEHTQPPSKKKKRRRKRKNTPLSPPGRVVCEFSLCCASFMPC